MKKKQQLDLLEPKPRRLFVKVEVSIPAARDALAAFARDRMHALDVLSHDLRSSVSEAFSQLMNTEMSLFLGQPEQASNKRNGYRVRSYYLKGVGALRLEVPRDRRGELDSVVVPSHERLDPRSRQDLALLHLAGLSNRTLSMISKRLLGVAVSKDTVSSSLSLLADEAEKWLTRPIEQRYWALYIDGTNFKVQRRGSTEREPSLVVLGVDESNRRSVLAVEPGTRDNVEAWRAVFRELKRRGLAADGVRIGIMDGLPGLENLFKDEFPSAVTQRCWLHAQRNAIAKSPARLRDAFKLLLDKVMYAPSENAAREAFTDLEQAMNKDARRAVACIEKDLDSLLAHYSFEQRFWHALKSTNAIERVNKELKRRTKSMESLGEGTLRMVVAFTALRLEMGWQMHPIDSKALKNLPRASVKELSDGNAIEKAIDQLSGTVH
jgi:putative transposase